MVNKTIYLIFILFLSHNTYSQWQQLNGPKGGYVRSIIYEDSTLFAATGGGVLVSDNQGESWAFHNEGLTSCDAKSLAKLGEYIFVSTDENVFRTNNKGLTWEQAGTELEGIYVKNIIESNNWLYAATYMRGLFRSTDYGDTWESINNGFPAKNGYYLGTDGTNLYVGTYLEGLYRSTDYGDTWVPINNGITEPNIMSIFCHQGKVFISTLSSGAFVSLDNGESWNPLEPNIPSIKGFTYLDGAIYAATLGHGVYKSTDNGLTWSTINTGLSEKEIWAIGVSDSDLYVGVGSGRIYTANSALENWSLSSSVSFYACAGTLCSSGPNLLSGTRGSGFFTSTDNGDNWTRIGSVWTVETRAVIASEPYVFAGTDLLGVFKSTNNGGSFSMSNTGLTTQWIQSFTFCQGKLFAGSGDSGIFRSSNNGSNWTQVNSGLNSLDILSLASDDMNVYAGSSNNGVYVSNDLGESWFTINNSLSESSIAALTYQDGYLFAGTKNNGIYRSDDNGVSWQDISNGTPGLVNIKCIHSYDSLLFVGTGNGEVFASDDQGDTWGDLTNDLMGAPVLSLWVFDGSLYAGLNAGGVWKMPLSLITKSDNVEADMIMHSYPNPTDNKMTIKIPKDYIGCFVSLFNSKGQQILKKKIQGDTEIIDVSFLESGVYFIKYGNTHRVFTTRFIKE